MSEDKVYKDGDIVWVKLGNNWWPGEVTGPARHPEGLITHLKRVPYCVVKFFNENTYEYVRSGKQIFPFQCAKQDEFIRKGYSLYNSGNSFMEKFPADVEVARQLISRKESSFIINDRPDSIVKAILGQPLIRTHDECYEDSEQREKRNSTDSVTKILNITPNRNNDAVKSQQLKAQTCDFCDFTSVRLNVMILHRKIHSNRNGLGSGNSTKNNATLKQISANSTPVASAKSVANVNADRQNKKLQNQNFKADITNKTKASTISTTKTAPPRTLPPLSRATIVHKTNASSNANNVDETLTISSKEKNNGNIKLTTTPKNKSKAARNYADEEKREEDVYAAILSDFCPSETETSSSEEKESRRSLRRCKNIIEATVEKLSTVCIDLSESKAIQKIPKKREYSTLQLENESVGPIISSDEPDVACLSDKEKAASAPSSSKVHSGSSKKNAEDIRKMLLADWSDDDETPADASVIDDSIVVVSTKNQERLEVTRELQNDASAMDTSTPLMKSSSSTGRIRNIPKKDRRDVVLQDFNRDLSFIHYDNSDHATNKTVAVDLDSSNSSVVEIIDEQQPTSIITINDDEDHEISKIQTSHDEVTFTENKGNDSAVFVTNDKPASSATSTSTLSCFDFQDDEDEHDNTTTTISHFKKKFLSGEKLQNLLLSPIDDSIDNNVTKDRAELAEKDQRLAADIETLLEQTQPTVTDLLNASSFEEGLSVKDLPIKERGKRIFKSRNKTRLGDKTNADLPVAVGMNFSAESQAQEDKLETNEETDSLNEDQSETNTKASVTEKSVEVTPNEEVLINSGSVMDISNDQTSIHAPAEISSYIEDIESSPTDNRTNEPLAGDNVDNETTNEGNENCLEISNEDTNTYQNEQTSKDIGNESTNVQQQADSLVEVQHEHDVLNPEVTEQLPATGEALVDRQTDHDHYRGEHNIETIDQPQPAAMKTTIPNSNEVPREIFREDGTADETVDDNELCEAFHISDVQTKEKPGDRVKVLDVQILKQSRGNLENDVGEKFVDKTIAAKTATEMLTESNETSTQTLDNGTSDKESQNAIVKTSSESLFKIRVKSPEQLLDQAFVAATQQEQELQRIVDIGIDIRLVSGTPTDENSSMGASDTGAEFGSPTSMLSEERLPAFRFQSNRTPQLEVEAAEITDSLTHNVAEVAQEVSNEGSGKSKTSDNVIKEQFTNDKLKNCPDRNHKSLQQRRFSMDSSSLPADLKINKRPRLSVDDMSAKQENCLEKPESESLAIRQKKIEVKVRPKSRHMKITPRRNVSELFKEHNAKHIANEAEKSSSLKAVKELPPVANTTVDKDKSSVDQELAVKPSEIVQSVGEICNKILNEKQENSTEASQPPKDIHRESSDDNVIDKGTENEDLEMASDHEVVQGFSEGKQEEMLAGTVESEKGVANKKEYNSNSEIQIEGNSTEEIKIVHKQLEADLISADKNQPEPQKLNAGEESMRLENGSKEIMDGANKSIVDKDSNHTEDVEENSLEIPDITEENKESDESSKSTPNDKHSMATCTTLSDQVLQNTFSPEIPPCAPDDCEIGLEKPAKEASISTDALSDVVLLPLNSKEPDNSLIQPPPTTSGKNASEKNETQPLREVDCPLTSVEKDSILLSNDVISTPLSVTPMNECESLVEPAAAEQSLDMVIEFDNTLPMPCTPREGIIDDECENIMQIPATPQGKDLIIECEPATPQCIIECDHSLPAQITPEKEVVIESGLTPDKRQDIIIEESLRLEDKETLLEREFQVIQPKESCVSIDLPQEPPTNTLQTDADKAAEEFLIEFDSIVNHNHTVEEDAQNSTVEDALNAEDLINNIIEEVHEDPQPKEDTATKSDPPIQFEALPTYTVVANKNSWHQTFKDTFSRQLTNPAKRRQTICFEISDTKEGVACKKQAFDFESVLPVNKTIKRTAERKLTLPAIETDLLCNSQPHSILAFNHNQIKLNKKLISSTTKRKLSIEDNITPFIIERPKPHQQSSNAASGPPPLQRITPLRRQSHIIAKTSLDTTPEPPPLQSHDNLLNDLFPTESSATTQALESDQKTEGGRVLHQQIISGPTPAISAIHQNKTTDSKISMNKQIGVDSRGNKYVIIKTPPTDIVVQPTLTSSTAATAPATTNFGTTITFQPLSRSSSEISTTKPITKNKNVSKQQLQQQQMKQISITVPAKSALEVSSLPEITAKTALRNRRRAAQAKAVAAATATANNDLNSAKHRQAMEALSRRLSIASEAPPLAKISRTASTNVQTQFSSNTNLSTLFGDAQLSNIAQQQLIQLQQQQQQQQTTQILASPLPPPIILNKNAHQQSVIQRKTRKIPSQQQTHMQHHPLPSAAKPLQLSQQQIPVQQQSQQLQPQIIAQIAPPQQTQPHTPLQPPPLQQIQQQTKPLKQQTIQQSDGVNITTATTEDDDVIISNSHLIALSTQPYPGYPDTFLLCKVKGNTCKPVDNVPLYLDEQQNRLVPVPLEAIESGNKSQGHQIEIKQPSNVPQQLLASRTTDPHESESSIQIGNINCNLVDDEISAGIETEQQIQSSQQTTIVEECVVDENGAAGANNPICDFGGNQELNTELVLNNGILLNIEGQQVLLDAATFAHLLANPDANTQLISDDGTEYVLTHEVLQALQIQQEQQQALELLNAAAEQQQLDQAASNDIIAVALAGSDLYDNDVLTIDTSQGMQLIDGDGSIVFPAQTGSITQQHLTPPAVVTNAVLDQSPIMSTLEVPSSLATAHKLQGTQLITVPSHHLATSSNAALGLGGRANLEDSLAAIGVTSQSSSIPSSLGLPITVTNPNIASKVTSAGPLNEMLQFVSHRPATAAATAAAVAAAALAGESRIFTD